MHGTKKYIETQIELDKREKAKEERSFQEQHELDKKTLKVANKANWIAMMALFFL